MCVILSITQLSSNPRIQQDIIENIEGMKYYNKDGFGLIGDNPKKNSFICRREMECHSDMLWDFIQQYQMLNIHLRFATAGVVAQKNVHFWQKGDWFFAHNGAVSDMAELSKKSDSYHFFNAIVNLGYLGENGKIKTSKIAKLKDSTGFWGRIVLYNKKLQKNWYFGDFQVYNLDNQMLVIATQKLDFEENNQICGIDFLSEPSFRIHHKELEGIFSLTLKQKSFKMINDKFGGEKTFAIAKADDKDWGKEWQEALAEKEAIEAKRAEGGIFNNPMHGEEEYAGYEEDGYWDDAESRWVGISECINDKKKLLLYDKWNKENPTKY